MPVWATHGSTTAPPVVNSLNAACEAGFVPDTGALLVNPQVTDQVPAIEALTEAVVTAYGADPPDLAVTHLDTETDFAAIAAHYRDTIEAAQADDEAVAVDVTPGRKFMSAIAFQAGIRYGADHVYYLHITSGGFRGNRYPSLPRTATDLVDFTETIQ